MIIVGTIIIIALLGVPQKRRAGQQSQQQAPGCKVKQAIRQMISFCITTTDCTRVPLGNYCTGA
jgi:hypothetical protein